MRPGQLPVDYVVQAVLAILGAVGLLALVLSGFLVVNTISAVLTQQTTQIGVMKAFGAQWPTCPHVFGHGAALWACWPG